MKYLYIYKRKITSTSPIKYGWIWAKNGNEALDLLGKCDYGRSFSPMDIILNWWFKPKYYIQGFFISFVLSNIIFYLVLNLATYDLPNYTFYDCQEPLFVGSLFISLLWAFVWDRFMK